MEFSEGRFTSCMGFNLHARYWKPQAEPKGVVFIAHGLSEHSGRSGYIDLAVRLQNEGFYAFSHDHVGHGKSGGNRIYIDKFEDYCRDVFTHFDNIKEAIPENCPKYIVGHSMGGTIAIKCGLMQPHFFNGFVLISPGLAADPQTAGTVKILLGKLVGVLFPNFPVHHIQPHLITSNPDGVREFVNDPLCYQGWVKAKWALAMLTVSKEFEMRASEIIWPYYLLQGTEDKITLPRFAQQFYDRTRSNDKRIKMYEHVFHSLLHEVDEVKESTLNEIVSWLNEKVTQN